MFLCFSVWALFFFEVVYVSMFFSFLLEISLCFMFLCFSFLLGFIGFLRLMYLYIEVQKIDIDTFELY